MTWRVLKKLPFWRVYSTRGYKKLWLKKNDPEYWVNYAKTANDPHRVLICSALKNLNWQSLFEVGCGSGPNLIAITRHFKGRQVGGSDINPVALKVASGFFKNIMLRESSSERILMSDKSTDISLSDMHLIYIGPMKIKQHLKELKRITRKHLILYEYHSESWIDRWRLRIFSGRHAYNYKKLLDKLGYYDIRIYKVKIDELDNDAKFRFLILANTPLRV